MVLVILQLGCGAWCDIDASTWWKWGSSGGSRKAGGQEAKQKLWYGGEKLFCTRTYKVVINLLPVFQDLSCLQYQFMYVYEHILKEY